MSAYYPLFLDVKGRRCVIVGGGHEAERKAAELAGYGASVTVVGPHATAGLQEMARRGVVDWVAKEYETGDLDGAFLAIAENDNPNRYKQVAWEAQQRGVLLNVVDVTHLCTFIAPAVVRRGAVTIAISTSGLSPALARRLREELEDSPILQWADMADLLADVRQTLRSKGLHPHPQRWQEAMDTEVLYLFHAGRVQEARELLLRRLDAQPVAS